MEFLSEIAQDISGMSFLRIRLFRWTHPMAMSASEFLGAPIEVQLVVFCALYAALGYASFSDIFSYLNYVIHRIIRQN